MERKFRHVCRLVLLFAFSLGSVMARDHIVGNSKWSIPTSNSFYSNWASNRAFMVGDCLVFRFEMGFYNVVQVSKFDYENCSTENPYRTFLSGPARVSLDEGSDYYFICTIGNYCHLGLRLLISVEKPEPPSQNNSSHAPAPAPGPNVSP
ncbi:early nodulin-like protein 2 [Rhynchospora pubera]|uniref:Early nodulin-like protein 2 n=1 Tax=Rhynchospora pubera TaxID=906938 RepID=A0AAV8F520_9POAL|nr:early nodulin-like protein 2 [Rhynchospora pubera]